MKTNSRRVWALFAVATLSLAACTGDDAPRDLITIPNLTGLDPDRAVGLVDRLDLTIRVEQIDLSGTGSSSPSTTGGIGGRLAKDVVVNQDPVAETQVEPGSTLTLFVPADRTFRSGERKFRLLTHCGLSHPMRFAKQFWLPVDPKLRRTVNPPRGFYSHGYYDIGTIRRIDQDTVVYTSSTGVEVEFEPTDETPKGCE